MPNITDSDVIGAFLTGTTCRDLVSKLGCKTPTKASELMDIATKFASGQEAVEAIFRKDKQPQGRQKEDTPEASVQRGSKKKAKKKAQVKRNVVDVDLVRVSMFLRRWINFARPKLDRARTRTGTPRRPSNLDPRARIERLEGESTDLI